MRLPAFVLMICCGVNSVRLAFVIERNSTHISQAIEILVNSKRIGSICDLSDYQLIRVNKQRLSNIREQICESISRGVTLIVGPSDSFMGGLVDVICSELNIPHINIFSDDLYQRKKTSKSSVNVFPAADQTALLNHLVLYSWDWNYFLVLYEHNHTPLKLLPAFTKSFHPPAMLKIHDTSDVGLLRAALALRQICDLRICWREINKVIVDLKPEHTLGLLNAALKLGMINIHNWFLLTGLDDLTTNFEQFSHNNMRISLMSLWGGDMNKGQKSDNSWQPLYNSWKVEHREHITPFKTFAVLHDALLAACQVGNTPSLQNQCGDEDTVDEVPKIAVKPFSGLLGPAQFDKNGQRSTSVIKLWELGFRGTAHMTGKWSTDESGNKQLNLNSRTVEGTHDHYMNQMRIQNLIRITTIEEAPYVIRKVLPNGKVTYEGFCIDLISKLAFSLRFQYQINLVKDGRYGEKMNGTNEWDGMVGEILREEADMAVAPMTVTAGRLEVIDFTDPFLQLGISMLMRQPKQESSASLTSFLWPLSASVWTFSAISTLITAVLVVVVAVISPTESAKEFNISNSFWYLMCILLRAGSGYNCQSLAARFLSAVWWSFTLVLISQYTANFAAVLTVDRKSMPFNSFEELGNQTDYVFGAMNRGSTLQFFKNSRIDTFQQIYEKMINAEPSALVPSNADGVDRVLQEKYVYLMESATLEYLVTKNCNLTRVGNVVLGSNGYGIALPKGSKWREKLTRQILDMHEKGIIMELKEAWWQKTQESCEEDTTDSSSLGSEHVQGLFALLAFGLGVALLTSFLEKTINVASSKISFPYIFQRKR